ncbi:DUF2497 domain-containing protein [Roseomonas sp. SXEYE001]|nr:DUF2497 domain-containing protein [Roseomonas sp. SXEYE001]
MEDILASIRKILNEEEAEPAAPTRPRQTPPPGPEPLELTEAMLVSSPPFPEAVLMPSPEVTVEVAPIAPLPPPKPFPPEPQPTPSPPAQAEPPAARRAPAEDEGLVAPATAAAAAALIGQLARTVAAERTAPVHRGGPSIEDVVREEIRPLLKEWIDTNLPPLMERLVRAEIERVVSRSLG